MLNLHCFQKYFEKLSDLKKIRSHVYAIGTHGYQIWSDGIDEN